MDSLKDQRIAILVTKGFEQVELTEPKKALDQAGARTDIVSPDAGTVKAWNFENWGDEFTVDEPLDRASADDYNALLLPGGLMNPDKLRRNEKALISSEGSLRRASRLLPFAMRRGF
jgi:protease I